jgi:SPP1 gp7 family putative phage head morphogenesis protein
VSPFAALARSSGNLLLATIAARRRAMQGKGRKLRVRRMPRQRQPDAIRAGYFAELRAIVREAQALVVRELFSQLPDIVEQAARRADAERFDAPIGKRLRALTDGMRERFEREHPASELERIAEKWATHTSRWHAAQLARQVDAGLLAERKQRIAETRAAITVDVIRQEPKVRPVIEDFVETNVALIRGRVLRPFFDDIEAIVMRDAAAGMRHEEIARELRGRFPMSENRAKLIARDQIGKFYGNVNEVRQTGLGVARYVWRTVQDNRVRDSHVAREGQVYSWDKPPEGGHPGTEVNCRCSADPMLDDLIGGEA